MESLRDSFGKALLELAEVYPDFVVFDADVAGGTSTHWFRERFPERFIQSGIAEQNMMSVAAGYSTTGRTPFVTTYGVFASMRALEQARNSVAYPDYNVKIVASHLGMDVGPDGASHQAIEDLAIFRAIPNMVVLAPADRYEMLAATEAILKYRGPVYMRSGRSPVPDVYNGEVPFEIGKGRLLRDGCDVAIVAVGVMVHRAMKAADELARSGIQARVVNMASIKPIDRDLLCSCRRECGLIITCEDHNRYGGLFGAVLEAISNDPCRVVPVAIDDRFGESGDPEELAVAYGIDVDSIVSVTKEALKG